MDRLFPQVYEQLQAMPMSSSTAMLVSTHRWSTSQSARASGLASLSVSASGSRVLTKAWTVARPPGADLAWNVPDLEVLHAQIEELRESELNYGAGDGEFRGRLRRLHRASRFLLDGHGSDGVDGVGDDARTP